MLVTAVANGVSEILGPPVRRWHQAHEVNLLTIGIYPVFGASRHIPMPPIYQNYVYAYITIYT